MDLTIKTIENGHSDPLHNVQKMPEILIYVLADGEQDGLDALSSRAPSNRPHTLVVGADGVERTVIPVYHPAAGFRDVESRRKR